jgi:cell division transport system permease protein
VRRLLRSVRASLRRAGAGIAATPLVHAVAAATLGVTLLVAGAFALLLRNLEGVIDAFGADLRMVVYVSAELPEDDREALLARARAAPGVVGVEWISEDEALRRFEAGVGERSGLLEGLEGNPLPASIELSLAPAQRTPEGVADVREALEGATGVEEISEDTDWVRGYARMVSGLRAGGLALGALLALATVLIVASTIRLAVYARRDEIEILFLVGASRTFVGLPFVLEGALQGLVGSALALSLLFVLFRWASPALDEALRFLVGEGSPVFLSPPEMAALAAVGTLVGAAGSLLALATSRRA